MASFTKLSPAEMEVISTFECKPEQAQEWRDNHTWEVLQDRMEASKWVVKAIHAENLNFEATESLQARKLAYWYASEIDNEAYFHLTPKGYKAAMKAGILHN